MPNADREHTTARETWRTRPDTITAPHRRGLLTGTLAALLTGAAAIATAKAAPLLATAGNDAELLALRAEYHLQHDVAYSPNGEDVDWETALDETWDILDEIVDLPVVTEAGRRAKAGVVDRLFAVEDRGDKDCVAVLAVLRELAGSAAISPTYATPGQRILIRIPTFRA
jgi:hypothetical protein